MRSQSGVYIKIELINKTTFAICESEFHAYAIIRQKVCLMIRVSVKLRVTEKVMFY